MSTRCPTCGALTLPRKYKTGDEWWDAILGFEGAFFRTKELATQMGKSNGRAYQVLQRMLRKGLVQRGRTVSEYREVFQRCAS